MKRGNEKMKNILNVTKNGYTVKVVDFGTYKDIKVDNGDNTVKFYEYDDFKLHTNIQNDEYSKIDFKIETISYGSLELEEMEDLISDYQLAVEAVKYIKNELKKLEKNSK